MPRLSFFLFVLLELSVIKNCAADGYYQYSAACSTAYNCFLALQPEKAKAALAAEPQANLMAVYIADYEDFLSATFSGKAVELARKEKVFSQRLALLETGNENDPYYRFCKAGLYFHWAIIRAQAQEEYKSALLFRKSFLLLKENEKAFPGFKENTMMLGMEQCLGSLIPDGYQWLSSLLGVRGNLRSGLSKVIAFLDKQPSGSFLKAEAAIYYVYIQFFLNYKQDNVWNYLNSAEFQTRDNLLRCFIKTNIALNYQKADAARQVLAYAATVPGYGAVPAFEYQQANALYLCARETALPYFQNYLRAPGDQYKKDCWRKMALLYHMLGKTAQAERAKAEIARTGSAVTDADKQAERFAKKGSWGDPRILKAHVLSDGGHFPEAITILRSVPLPADADNRLEYLFVQARSLEGTGDVAGAMNNYQQVVEQGRKSELQYAARASLNQGLICEKQGRRPDAIARYKDCLSMKDHEFQSSIDKRAKAGLERLGSN